MTITQTLHYRFIQCGEILSAEYIAQIVCDYERQEETRLDDREIFSAINDAADSFVDAMQENAFQTWVEQGRQGKEDGLFESEAAFLNYLADYESMRLATVRERELKKAISATFPSTAR